MVERVAALPALVPEVDDRVDALEEVGVLGAVGIDEVLYDDALNALAAPVGVDDVDEHHLVLLLERRQELVGNIPGRSGHKHFLHGGGCSFPWSSVPTTRFCRSKSFVLELVEGRFTDHHIYEAVS